MAQALGLYYDLRTPFYRHIRIFGVIAWLLLKGLAALAKGQKIAPRAIKGKYLGAISHRGHIIYV